MFPPFQEYACHFDRVECDREGFHFVARIEVDDSGDGSPEDRRDGFWPSLDPKNAGYIGPKSKATLARHMAKAREIMRAWNADEWSYVGVAVTASRNGIKLGYASLWGVEMNYPGSDNVYLRDVANDLLEEALYDAKATLASLCEGVR